MTGAGLLVYLDASHNQLTSIHGLAGCCSLQHLQLSHNRITRVGKTRLLWQADVCHCVLCLQVCIRDKCVMHSMWLLDCCARHCFGLLISV